MKNNQDENYDEELKALLLQVFRGPLEDQVRLLSHEKFESLKSIILTTSSTFENEKSKFEKKAFGLERVVRDLQSQLQDYETTTSQLSLEKEVMKAILESMKLKLDDVIKQFLDLEEKSETKLKAIGAVKQEWEQNIEKKLQFHSRLTYCALGGLIIAFIFMFSR